jgi:hypothetical protein
VVKLPAGQPFQVQVEANGDDSFANGYFVVLERAFDNTLQVVGQGKVAREAAGSTLQLGQQDGATVVTLPAPDKSFAPAQPSVIRFQTLLFAKQEDAEGLLAACSQAASLSLEAAQKAPLPAILATDEQGRPRLVTAELTIIFSAAPVP